MAQTIKLKRSATPSAIPTTSNLELGELALNTNDAAIYIKRDDGTSPDDILAIHHEPTMHIDYTNNRIGIGTASPQAKLDIEGDGRFFKYTDSTFGYPILKIHRTRGTSAATAAAVQDGDYLGELRFTGLTSGFSTATGTSIRAKVSGTIDQTEMPTNLEFLTTGEDTVFPTVRMTLDSSGRLLIGPTTSRQTTGGERSLQIEGTSGTLSSMSLVVNKDAQATGPSITLGKTRSTTTGGVTTVVDNDNLGSLRFAGADGVDLDTIAAQISAEVDGAVSTGTVPAALLFTIGDEKMRISNAGNVGIGTASPTSTLDLTNGTDTAERAIRIQNDTVVLLTGVEGSAGNRFVGSAVGNAFFGTTSAHGLELGTNNNVRMVIDSNGDVGIGAVAQSGRRLHVTTANDYVAKFESTDAGSYIVLEDNGSTNNANRIGVASDEMRIYTADAERMRIDSSGNVGIGTDSPTSTLTVFGTNDAAGGLEFQGPSADDGTSKVGRIKTQHYTNAEEPFTAILTNAQQSDNVVQIGGASGAENAATRIGFWTASNNTTLTGTEVMRVNSAQNVGIGETSTMVADYKLQVRDDGTAGTTPLLISNRDTSVGTTQNVALSFGLSRESGSFKPQAGRIRVGRESASSWDASDANIDSYMDFSVYENNALSTKMTIQANSNVTFAGGITTVGASVFNSSSASDPDSTSRTNYPAGNMFTHMNTANGVSIIGGQGSYTGTSLTIGEEAARSANFNFIRGISDTNGTPAEEFSINGVGDAVFAGNVEAVDFNSTSDKTLKTDIKDLDLYGIIDQLRPVSFKWEKNEEKAYGLIAQEVEIVLPQIVSTNEKGTKSIMYNQLIPFLIQEIKNLKKEVSILKEV